jgi:hypothetical protein
VLLLAAGNEPPRKLWSVSGAPLRVWIQPSPHTHQVRLAVAEWNAQRLPLRMRLGADSASADVRLYWIDHFDEAISGRTTAVDDGDRRIVSASVTLAFSHSDGHALTSEEVRVLALHELGHAIGLDHTNEAGSIMRARVRVRAISPADRERAMRLYSSR